MNDFEGLCFALVLAGAVASACVPAHAGEMAKPDKIAAAAYLAETSRTYGPEKPVLIIK